MTPTSVSRRGLLGGVAATGALAAGGLAVPAHRASAAGAHGRIPEQADVVVVGAGLSGLVAAQRLARDGRSVVVLEARDRVGGRILNHTLDNGSVVESGAAFVGPTQNHILELARELGVKTFPQYIKGDNVYYSDGRSQRYQGTVPPDPLLLADAATLIKRINMMSRDVPVDAPWAAPKAAQWDAMSLHDWVRENSANPEIQTLLLCYLQPTFGTDAREISLLFALWYIAASGDETHPGTFERSASVKNGAQERRFVGGSQLIPLRLAEQLGNAVELNAPVRQIAQDEDKVTVSSDRGTITASRLVVAVPPQTASAIDWHPLLPPKRSQLLQRLPMGTLMKCDAVYPEPFWRANGLSGFGLATEGAVRVCFDNSPPGADVGVLLAFVGGSTWREWGVRSLRQRRAAVLEGFSKIVGLRALEPIDYVEHDWTHDRWTLGGPVAAAGTATTDAYGAQIRQPFGRVHWAGTETSTYWAGYMDGAVRAGERVAVEVTDRL